jgi:hypothetical protein
VVDAADDGGGRFVAAAPGSDGALGLVVGGHAQLLQDAEALVGVGHRPGRLDGAVGAVLPGGEQGFVEAGHVAEVVVEGALCDAEALAQGGDRDGAHAPLGQQVEAGRQIVVPGEGGHAKKHTIRYGA